MQILLNTDRHIRGGAELQRMVETHLATALARFHGRITRVEVHLSDENSAAKAVGDDKRCVLEARLGGLQPLTASHHGPSLEDAVVGAAARLETVIDRTLGRLVDRRDPAPAANDDPE